MNNLQVNQQKKQQTMLTAVLINDNKNNQALLEKKLKLTQAPLKITGAFINSYEAIEFINTNTPGLILSDIDMPDINGIELVKHIQHLAIPVIFLSSDETYALKALKLSAIDYLLKPVDLSELTIALGKVVNIKNKTLQQVIQQQLFNPGKAYNNQTLVVNTQEKAMILSITDIIQIEAKQSYSVILDIHGNTITSSKPLQYYHEILKDLGFFRSHRSFLINKNQIAEVIKDGKVLMRNGFKAIVSKENLSDLISELGMK